jgi:hypothetical protein
MLGTPCPQASRRDAQAHVYEGCSQMERVPHPGIDAVDDQRRRRQVRRNVGAGGRKAPRAHADHDKAACREHGAGQIADDRVRGQNGSGMTASRTVATTRNPNTCTPALFTRSTRSSPSRL